MKKIVRNWALVTCLFLSNGLMAQEETEINQPLRKKWFSEKGYWVVETNVKEPQNAVVHFFTNDNNLIYTEKVNGKVLNFKKRKTLLQLKKALETVVSKWEATGRVEDQEMITALLNNK